MSDQSWGTLSDGRSPEPWCRRAAVSPSGSPQGPGRRGSTPARPAPRLPAPRPGSGSTFLRRTPRSESSSRSGASRAPPSTACWSPSERCCCCSPRPTSRSGDRRSPAAGSATARPCCSRRIRKRAQRSTPAAAASALPHGIGHDSPSRAILPEPTTTQISRPATRRAQPAPDHSGHTAGNVGDGPRAASAKSYLRSATSISLRTTIDPQCAASAHDPPARH